MPITTNKYQFEELDGLKDRTEILVGQFPAKALSCLTYRIITNHPAFRGKSDDNKRALIYGFLSCLHKYDSLDFKPDETIQSSITDFLNMARVSPLPGGFISKSRAWYNNECKATLNKAHFHRNLGHRFPLGLHTDTSFNVHDQINWTT
ncbi:hypothetical protein GQX74_011200 [Glossina fuscipes]|nr:hypothetical protein GQX74_011200 [Glossina fuscipes]